MSCPATAGAIHLMDVTRVLSPCSQGFRSGSAQETIPSHWDPRRSFPSRMPLGLTPPHAGLITVWNCKADRAPLLSHQLKGKIQIPWRAPRALPKRALFSLLCAPPTPTPAALSARVFGDAGPPPGTSFPSSPPGGLLLGPRSPAPLLCEAHPAPPGRKFFPARPQPLRDRDSLVHVGTGYL